MTESANDTICMHWLDARWYSLCGYGPLPPWYYAYCNVCFWHSHPCSTCAIVERKGKDLLKYYKHQLTQAEDNTMNAYVTEEKLTSSERPLYPHFLGYQDAYTKRVKHLWFRDREARTHFATLIEPFVLWIATQYQPRTS